MRTYSSNNVIARRIFSFYNQVSDCIYSIEDRVMEMNTGGHANVTEARADSPLPQWQDEPDYADGRRRTRSIPKGRPRGSQRGYRVHVEYPTQPGHRGLIRRGKDGKFILETSREGNGIMGGDNSDDEGGFDVNLPPNRYRTRSVAIVAGYTPERLYSNVPSGSSWRQQRVVESGVYKVSASRPQQEPIYWQQLVFGSEGSTLPHRRSHPQQQFGSRQVGRLQEEDLNRLRALEATRQPSAASLIQTSNLELRRTLGTSGAGTSHPKLRTSSPLSQQQVPAKWGASPIANGGHSYSDVSTVSHRERSLPSTLLTNPMSSLSSPPTSANFSSSQSQSHSLHQHHPNLLPMIAEEAPPAYSSSTRSVIQADVHHQQQQLQQRQRLHPAPQLAPQPIPRISKPPGVGRRRKSGVETVAVAAAVAAQAQSSSGGASGGDYWSRATYRSADADLFPNYALNYPAPLHYTGGHTGSISPSRQYPDLESSQRQYWQSLYVQPAPGSRAVAPPLVHPMPLPHYENMRYHLELQRQQQQQQLHVKPPPPKRPPKKLSLASEVLDAEVTAITNSGGSSGPDEEDGEDEVDSMKKHPPADSTTNSSRSKSNQTGSSSQHTMTTTATSSSLFTDKSDLMSSPQPYYENWPPPKTVAPTVPLRVHPPSSQVQFLAASSPLMLSPHFTSGASAKPQVAARSPVERRIDATTASPMMMLTTGMPHDTTIFGGGDPGTNPPSRLSGSRPGSSHSAPGPHDTSIDHHYEFDTRTPTDDLLLTPADLAASVKAALPRQWNRPYLGYDPRSREGDELSVAARLARSEKRVFSDSEIYSPVFPRGRPPGEPEGRKGAAAPADVSARVRAMKKEFREYKEEMEKKATEASFDGAEGQRTSPGTEEDKKLESLI